MILSADSEDPDKTAQMRRLIWTFDVRTCPKTRFRMARPEYGDTHVSPPRPQGTEKGFNYI